MEHTMTVDESSDLPGSDPLPSNYKMKLTFDASQATLAIAHANRRLAASQFQQAHQEYTSVLKQIAPGHPVAFLNRSLCYLLLDFPQLAVIDAYRAFLSVEGIECLWNNDHSGRLLLSSLAQYTREADAAIDRWKKEPGEFVGNGKLKWLDVDLASICVRPNMRAALKKKRPKKGEELAHHMVHDVKMKACYRVALALWKCGGGAWSSAMDWTCAAEALPICSPKDEGVLKDLHNCILAEIERVIKEEKDNRVFGYQEESGIRGLLQTRFTAVRREVFPWDKWNVTWTDEEANLGSLSLETEQHTGNLCRLQLKADAYPLAVLSVVANQPLEPHQVLFRETCLVHAIEPHPPYHHYCKTCCAALKLHPTNWQRAQEHSEKYAEHVFLERRSRQNTVRAEGASSAKPSSSEISEENDSEDGQITAATTSEDLLHDKIDSPAMELDHVQDVLLPEFERPQGYQLCPLCQQVAFCSIGCAENGHKAFHRHLCGLDIHNTSYVLPPESEWSLPSPTTTSLLNQLVQSVLASTVTAQPQGLQHDLLANNWSRQLDGGMTAPRKLLEDGSSIENSWDGDRSISIHKLFPEFMADSKVVDGRRSTTVDPSPKTIPWSFNSNVLLPIQTLYDIAYKQGTTMAYKAALDCRRFDGWVLETLRCKIESGMRVSRYPRVVKTVDERGLSGPGERTQHHIITNGIGEGPGTWMASLNPRLKTIRKAGESEEPNVAIEENEGIVVVVTTRAVAEGEELLS